MRPTYVVHSVTGAVRAALPGLLVAVVVGVGGVVQGQRVFAGIVVVVLVVLTVASARRGWTRVRVDDTGIALSYPVRGSYSISGAVCRRADWRFVHRVIVTSSDQRVQVVLRNDAPMPAWMTSRIIDPNDSEGGVSYDREVPGLDATALTLAVRGLAPHVEVRTPAG